MQVKKGAVSDVNPTNQVLIEYHLHLIEKKTVDEFVREMTLTVDGLADTIKDAIENKSKKVDDYRLEIAEALSKLRRNIFNQNVVIDEAWNRSVASTRQNSKYSQVATKMNRKLDELLDEIRRCLPADDKVGLPLICTDFINKHHILLKSIHPDRQVEAANLLHSGHGSAASSNTSLHRAMHKLTSLKGENYKLMDKAMENILKQWVEKMERDYPYLI